MQTFPLKPSQKTQPQANTWLGKKISTRLIATVRLYKHLKRKGLEAESARQVVAAAPCAAWEASEHRGSSWPGRRAAGGACCLRGTDGEADGGARLRLRQDLD